MVQNLEFIVQVVVKNAHIHLLKVLKVITEYQIITLVIVVEQDTLMIDFLIKKFIKYLRNTMKKIFISIFIIAISFSFVNAESKPIKTDAELMKEMEDLVKQEKEAEQRIKKSKKEIEALDKAQKTADEIKNKLGVDKK